MNVSGNLIIVSISEANERSVRRTTTKVVGESLNQTLEGFTSRTLRRTFCRRVSWDELMFLQNSFD